MILSLLIDGYNLLHATGAVRGAPRRRSGASDRGHLARARERLLGQLAVALTDQQRQETQIVFDARRKVKGDEEQVVHGMTVTYSVGFEEADDLLEQIIRRHPQPRRLTVVSSDLRVQRTAKARHAKAISCDQWLMQLLDSHERTDPRTSNAGDGSDHDDAAKTSLWRAKESRPQMGRELQQPSADPELAEEDGAGRKPQLGQPLSAEEVARWLDEFGFRP